MVNINYYIQDIDTFNQRQINIEYLNDYISLKVPYSYETLYLKPITTLAEIKKGIENTFEEPVNNKTIDGIVSLLTKLSSDITVAIVVSDYIRSVPC